MLLLGGRLPKQALAWYASTVTETADSSGSTGINLQLSGRVVLVTGGVRGVGAGISAVFAGQGATVVTCARRPVEGSPYEFHSCDVRDDESVKALIDAVVTAHGRIDVVVNNAGGSPYVPAAEASAKFSSKIIELNLLGPLSVSTHANAVMQTQQQRRLDRQHRKRQREAPDAGDRRLRGGQGGPGEHHQHARR